MENIKVIQSSREVHRVLERGRYMRGRRWKEDKDDDGRREESKSNHAGARRPTGLCRSEAPAGTAQSQEGTNPENIRDTTQLRLAPRRRRRSRRPALVAIALFSANGAGHTLSPLTLDTVHAVFQV